MKRNRSPIIITALFFLACAQSLSRANDTANAPDSAVASSARNDEAAALAAKIDEMIASRRASGSPRMPIGFVGPAVNGGYPSWESTKDCTP